MVLRRESFPDSASLEVTALVKNLVDSSHSYLNLPFRAHSPILAEIQNEVAISGGNLKVLARKGTAMVRASNRTVEVKEGTTMEATLP